ncbi:hypothetical protein ACI78T_06740 [Blastococcus sp. SYSU D00922]
MSWFRSTSTSLPRTSYGYLPPPGATAHGWICPDQDCGIGEHEPVRRWPKACPSCGTAADPQLDPPWKHDAEGVELQWILRNDPGRGGGYHQDQWLVWQFRDAVLRRDPAAVSEARARVRTAIEAGTYARFSGPGSILFHLVWIGLENGDPDGVADDLCFWLAHSAGEDAETDNGVRTNVRQVIDLAARFVGARDGAAHPRAPEIRRGCLRLAEGAFSVLNRDQQQAVTQMTRA